MDWRVQKVKQSVSKEIWNQARSDALKRGITITEWINEAINEKLEKKN